MGHRKAINNRKNYGENGRGAGGGITSEIEPLNATIRIIGLKKRFQRNTMIQSEKKNQNYRPDWQHFQWRQGGSRQGRPFDKANLSTKRARVRA